MTLGKQLTRLLFGASVVVVATTSVGLTAPADGPFSIGIRPVLFRLDPEALADRSATALGIDLDVKVGRRYFHVAWSAVPLLSPAVHERQTAHP